MDYFEIANVANAATIKQTVSECRRYDANTTKFLLGEIDGCQVLLVATNDPDEKIGR